MALQMAGFFCTPHTACKILKKEAILYYDGDQMIND